MAQTWKGSCHCGAVKYEVTMDLGTPIECNCSICGRVGALRSFAPPSAFKLLSGGDNLVSYKFNKKHIDHTFCRTCGVHSFARGVNPKTGEEMMAINVRCLEGVDPWTLETKKFEGKKL